MLKSRIRIQKLIGAFLILWIVISILSPRVQAATGINEQLNFQGKLVDGSGLNVANGTYNIEFKIYCGGDGTPGSTSSDCTNSTTEHLLWTETRTSTDKVTVTDGVFQVNLGEVTPFGSSVDWNQDKLWLSINVGGTGSPSWDGEMGPMIRLTTVPYAQNAKKVNGLTVTNTSDNPFSSTTTLKLPDGNTYTVASPNSGTTDTIDTLTAATTLTNKTIGSTGLVFSGATTDITTASGENLTITAAGAGIIQLSDTVDIGTNTLQGTSAVIDFSNFDVASGGSLTLGGSAIITLPGGQTKDITTASAGTSAALVFAPGDSTTNSGTGSSLTLRGSNQTGTTSTGGKLVLQGGTGTSTNGSIEIGLVNTLGITLGASGINTTVAGTLAANGASGITSSQPTLTINAGGNVDIQDTLNVDNITTDTGGISIAAGQSYSGSGAVTLSSGSGANLSLLAGTSGQTQVVQIGAGGTGSTSPDYFALDVKSDTGDPSGGVEGEMYYNTFDNKFRCFENTAWTNCIGSSGGGITTIQEGASNVTTAATIINFTAADFIISGATGTGTVSIDYPNSHITRTNQAETVTGGWTFNTAGTTFTTAINANGGITTSASNQNLGFTANGSGDYTFASDNDTNLQLASTISSDVTINPLDIVLTDNASASTGTIYGLSITNADNSTNIGVPDALAYLNNANAAETVANGLYVEQTGGGTLTNGIQVKQTSGAVTTGLRFAGTFTNFIDTPSSVFKVTNSGGVTGATVTSAGLLTASNGLTMSNGALSLTASSGSVGLALSSSATAFNVNSGVFDIDTQNSRVGIGTTGPNAKLDSLATTEQLRLSYDATHYSSFTTDSTGALTIAPTSNSMFLSATAINVVSGATIAISNTSSNQLLINNTSSGTLSLHLVDGDLIVGNNAGISNTGDATSVTNYVTSTAPPGLDISGISNVGNGTTTTGVDAQQIDFAIGAVTSGADNAGLRVNVTSNAPASGTSTLEGISIPALTSANANVTETALQVGTGWDVGLSVQSGGITVSGGSFLLSGSGRSTKKVTLVPEFPGAVMTGDGSSNLGTMTSDFCSNGNSNAGAGIPDTNTTDCPTSGDVHNYYKWASTSGTNDYDIWVPWQVPSDFSEFASSTAVKFNANKTAAGDAVTVTLYNDTKTTKCGSATAVASNGAWAQTNYSDPTGCDVASGGQINAGDVVFFRVQLSSTGSTSYARIGEIEVSYLAKF